MQTNPIPAHRCQPGARYATPTGRIVVAEVADDGCIDFRAEQSGRIIASTREHAPPMRPLPAEDVDEQPELLAGPALAWDRRRAETIAPSIEAETDPAPVEPEPAPAFPITDEVIAHRTVAAILSGVREARAALRDIEDAAILERAWLDESARPRPRQTILDMIAARASAIGADPSTWDHFPQGQGSPEEAPEATAPSRDIPATSDAPTGAVEAAPGLAPIEVIAPPAVSRLAGPSQDLYDALRGELREALSVVSEQSNSLRRLTDAANASAATIRAIAEALDLEMTPDDDARALILSEIRALQVLSQGSIPRAANLLDAIAETRARGFRVSLTLETT